MVFSMLHYQILYIAKFSTLTILSVQFSGIDYICNVELSPLCNS